MKPRITLFAPVEMLDERSEASRAILDAPRGEIVGPLRATMHVSDLASLWAKFGGHLDHSAEIPARARELAKLVCARRWSSQVEWESHAAKALAAGLPNTTIDALAEGQTVSMRCQSDIDVYDFTRQLLEAGDVEDSSHKAIVDRWGESGVVALTAIVGFGTMASLMTNSQAIPTTDGDTVLARLVPDGQLVQLPGCKLDATVSNSAKHS